MSDDLNINLESNPLPKHTTFMIRHFALFPILCSTVCLTLTEEDGGTQAVNTKTNDAAALLQPWPGPYGGVPPWQSVQPEAFASAFENAIKLSTEEIDATANHSDSPTFENTIVALETAGRALSRLSSMYSVHASNLNVGPMPEIQKVVMPKLAAYEDSVTQNEKLFARIAAVYESDALKSLSVAQHCLVEKRYKSFLRQGAKLNAEEKAKLSEINQRLAELFSNFSQNVLDDEQSYVTWIASEAELKGLPKSTIDAMINAAKERSTEGQRAVTKTRSSMAPFLTYADNRALREKVWRTYYDRGVNGDAKDNNKIITEILKLRAQRAKLLGYGTHAHWRLEPQMAKTPEATMALVTKVWPKAVARVREEVADMQKIADDEGAEITIEPWDYRYYAEKVRKARYDLDSNDIKPYLQLEKLRETMMWCSTKLF
jgi:peptidyl-dipeptidase Dcp